MGSCTESEAKAQTGTIQQMSKKTAFNPFERSYRPIDVEKYPNMTPNTIRFEECADNGDRRRLISKATERTSASSHPMKKPKLYHALAIILFIVDFIQV